MEKIKIGTQCRNVFYCGKPDNVDFDLHLVKYTDYYDDGSSERKIKFIKDFNKTFWVTNKKNRKYTQKKERFPISECEEVKCPNYMMLNEAKKKLGYNPSFNVDPREVLKGLFCFGTDLSSSAELKYKYNQTPLAKKTEKLADVAAFDVETNVVDKDKWEHIDMATLSFKDVVITVVNIDFIRRTFPRITKEEALERLYKTDNVYLDKINKERNIKQEFYLVDKEIEVLQKVFQRAHELKPDFIEAWNMDYDISRSIEACKRAKIDPADIFCDPTTPKPFKSFKYNPGKESGLSKKGVWKNYANFEKWPQVYCPASFVFADAMCFYYNSRKHLGKLPKYSLDYILEREFPDEITEGMSEKEIAKREHNSLIRKLKFDEAKALNGTIEWHQFMQTHYPFEYIIYNKFDCIALEYLDEQTLDICHSLPSGCEFSDYKDYESEPKRLANEMHWFNLDRGYAYGTGGANNKIDLDDELIGRDDWIITLRADLLVEPGTNLMEDASGLFTNIHEDNADIDVTSSYPKSNLAMNTSRETLVKELISIEGISEQDRRECGINMSGGFINSVEISTKLFDVPQMSDMLKAYRSKKEN